MHSKDSQVAARQTPLYRAYAQDPGEAISLKQVTTVWRREGDALHGTVNVPRFPGISWDYGIDGKVGGYDDLPNPGHLLCAALAACVDSTIRMLADRLGVEIERLEVAVDGDVDVRGCLAIEPSVRAGFRRIRCSVELRPGPAADPRSVGVVLERAEQLCVTLDTLRNGVPVQLDTKVTTVATGA